jgi:hypothetical protein
MVIDESIKKHRSYSMSELREKMPKYDRFPPEKITAGSHEEKLDKEPIATTNPNLHMRHDSDIVVKRGEGELFDRNYEFLGLAGNVVYSTVETFVHDEEDTELSEIP